MTMKRFAGELTSLDQCQDTVGTVWLTSSDWYVETFRYLNGNIKPHYPVPVVPTIVCIRDYVVIISEPRRDKYGLGQHNQIFWKED